MHGTEQLAADALAALVDASGAMNSADGLDATLAAIAISAAGVMNAEASSVIMLDKARGKQVFRAAFGQRGDRLIGVVSTRLGNIHPSIKIRQRKVDFEEIKNTSVDLRSVEPLVRKARVMNKEDKKTFDLARKNADAKTIQQLIIKYKLGKEYTALRKVLDRLLIKAKEVGIDIERRKHYHPRRVKDLDGFWDFIHGLEAFPAIQEAINVKEGRLGRTMSMEERIDMANTLLRGYRTSAVTLVKPGAAKERTVGVITEELDKFYYDSDTALIHYIHTMNNAIAARKFFGKTSAEVSKIKQRFNSIRTRLAKAREAGADSKRVVKLERNLIDADKQLAAAQSDDVQDSIGGYILGLIAEGKIKPSQERELKELFNARYNAIGTHGIVTAVKNIGYLHIIGTPRAAITQLGDIALSMYKTGWRTLPTTIRSIVGASKITKKDIGVEHIASELTDSSSSGSALGTVLKMVGFDKIDKIGKESLINGVIDQYRSRAKRNDPKLSGELEPIFGKETSEVIDDLKTGKKSDNVLFLAFNELADMQPISLSEVPEGYLTAGNGRIFYMLKTWTIKLLDIYRREVFQQFRKHPVRAMKNLIVLTSLVVLAEGGADALKDILFNRPIKDLSDLVIDNLLSILGMSRYQLDRSKYRGPLRVILESWIPPTAFIDIPIAEIRRIMDDKSIGEWQRLIPVIGELYYWRFGRGREKVETKARAKLPTKRR